MSTNEIVSELSKAESQNSGEGPIKGGAAAAAQSLLDKERNLAAAIKKVESKAPEDITQADASELQSAQDRLLGRDVRNQDSLASKTQSQADHNKQTNGNGDGQPGSNGSG